MGHLQQKYTTNYFLQFDQKGRKTNYGVVGLEDFLLGQPRPQDQSILRKIDFKNKKVLDIGFGRGEVIKYAKEHEAKKVIGVDFSKPAYEIALNFLDIHQIEAKLYCQDALNFIQNTKQRFDIVIMFDVVEHIPRSELTRLLKALKLKLAQKSILLINTPVFALDNDVAKDGLKAQNFEDTDEIAATKDLHINRYTKTSLKTYLHSFGFFPLSGHIFVYHLSGQNWFNPIGHNWRVAASQDYPVNPTVWYKKEVYEYAYSRKQKRLENKKLSNKLLSFPKWFVKACLYRLDYRTAEEKRRAQIQTLPILYGPKRGQKISGNVFTDLKFQKQLLGLRK
ncbi:class I SAM-dependent methyltransferase [Candidatus Beckwithbacteria bacterium]|nr:class I SAM-dependent methyltransferase [Candidatus Beckwithbacteria bacterium]